MNFELQISNREFTEASSDARLKARTKQFAPKVFRVRRGLPPTDEFKVLTRRLLHSSSSVAANYRSACPAKSKTDWISTGTTVEDEMDESARLIEMIEEQSKVLRRPAGAGLGRLWNEANEFVAILVSSRKPARHAD